MYAISWPVPVVLTPTPARSSEVMVLNSARPACAPSWLGGDIQRPLSTDFVDMEIQ